MILTINSLPWASAPWCPKGALGPGFWPKPPWSSWNLAWQRRPSFASRITRPWIHGIPRITTDPWQMRGAGWNMGSSPGISEVRTCRCPLFTEKLSEHLKWWIKLIKLNKLDFPLSMDTILSNNPYSEREDFSGFVGTVSNSFHQY